VGNVLEDRLTDNARSAESFLERLLPCVDLFLRPSRILNAEAGGFSAKARHLSRRKHMEVHADLACRVFLGEWRSMPAPFISADRVSELAHFDDPFAETLISYNTS
jgi:hypothetical protein